MKNNAKGCVKIYIFIKNNFMLKNNYSGFDLECGTDEAGRGCLAGPVTAAAVILPTSEKGGEFSLLKKLNDSKQLSEKVREELKPIIEKTALSFSVSHIYNEEIDTINILNAAIKAMQESVLKLNPLPLYIIVDGNKFKPVNNIPFSTIIKGDSKYRSIAAASVLAKTYRDEFMNRIHEEFPMYNWKKNKGYPTKEHREAIRKYGVTKYHRMSFRLLPEQLSLDF